MGFTYRKSANLGPVQGESEKVRLGLRYRWSRISRWNYEQRTESQRRSSPNPRQNSGQITPFESIRRTNPAGNEFRSSRDFAKVLGYADYRNFQSVIESARTACFNSGQRVEDHFVEVTDMIEVGKGAKRPAKSVMMSRYACYLVIQNADPSKEIVALGQTYFAIQTRRQELSDEEMEEQRRLAIRSELGTHNSQLADAAKDAGVIDPRDYAIFQNHGYIGLYGGLGA